MKTLYDLDDTKNNFSTWNRDRKFKNYTKKLEFKEMVLVLKLYWKMEVNPEIFAIPILTASGFY